MKKFIKFASMLSMSGILVLSTAGCSCSMKQGKINSESRALSESDLFADKDGNAVDFTATYRFISGKEGIESETYIVSRDADTKTYYLSHYVNEGESGDNLKSSYKLYTLNGSVYSLATNVSTSAPNKLEYNDTYSAYRYGNQKYYSYISEFYDKLKLIPYNGCSEGGDQTDLPDILIAFIEDSNRDNICEAKRKLFSKKYTFYIKYAVSVTQADSYEIRMNKEDKIEYAYITYSHAEAGANVKHTVEYTVSYDEVK